MKETFRATGMSTLLFSGNKYLFREGAIRESFPSQAVLLLIGIPFVVQPKGGHGNDNDGMHPVQESCGRDIGGGMKET